MSAIGFFRFVTKAAGAEARNHVTAPVGFAQLKGLAARARAMREAGKDDDSICAALSLAPGQIMKLLSLATKAANAAAERSANGGRMLTRGEKLAGFAEGAARPQTKAAVKAANSKGSPSRVIDALAGARGPMSIEAITSAAGLSGATVRKTVKALAAEGRIRRAEPPPKHGKRGDAHYWELVS